MGWDFVELGDEMQGYQHIRVTPYMHCMVFHVLQMFRKYGNIKQFLARVRKLHMLHKSMHCQLAKPVL